MTLAESVRGESVGVVGGDEASVLKLGRTGNGTVEVSFEKLTSGLELSRGGAESCGCRRGANLVVAAENRADLSTGVAAASPNESSACLLSFASQFISCQKVV